MENIESEIVIIIMAFVTTANVSGAKLVHSGYNVPAKKNNMDTARFKVVSYNYVLIFLCDFQDVHNVCILWGAEC